MQVWVLWKERGTEPPLGATSEHSAFLSKSAWPMAGRGGRARAKLTVEGPHSKQKRPGFNTPASAWTPLVPQLKAVSWIHASHKVLLKQYLSSITPWPPKCFLIFTYVIWGVWRTLWFFSPTHHTPPRWAWERLAPFWTKAIRGRSSSGP